MAPSKSEARSATSASRPVARVAKPAARAVVCLGGLIALIASILVLVAAPASAVPTAGNRNAATADVIFKVAPPASGSAPSLGLTFVTNNTTRCPVTRNSPRLFANNSSFTWIFRTNFDPTPTAVTSPNSDQVDCSYTATIVSNLEGCSYAIAGITPTTATTFTLTGGDSPNYSTGAGAIQNLAADKTITITPSSCTAPAANTIPRLVRITNLEVSQRYRVNFESYGNCRPDNTPLEIADYQIGIFAILDLRCNWQMSAYPVSNVIARGCIVDAIVYYHDGTQELVPGASLFIHTSGNFAGFNSKRLTRIDLQASRTIAGAGVCEERFRIRMFVDLPSTPLANTLKAEQVEFVVEPADARQNRLCTQSTTVKGSNNTPASVDVVKSPRGVVATCSYRITADQTAGLLRFGTRNLRVQTISTSLGTQADLRFLYIPNRIPVRVTAEINTPSGSVFTTNDRISVQVTVPDECGTDTSLFGGVTGRVGIAYSVFVSPGTVAVIGPGSRIINPNATYDLPPSVLVNGQRVACKVRVTEITPFEGCTLQTLSRDSSNRPYLEVQWAAGATSFNLNLQYDCGGAAGTPSAGSGQIALPQGWVMLTFNGATGTTPANFRRVMDNAFSSIWMWDTPAQAWKGWRATDSSPSLTSLTKGDVVFIYVPRLATARYSPSTLLNPKISGGSETLQRGWNLLSYSGSTSTSMASLFDSRASSIPVIFRWNNDSQTWSYYIPGGSRVVTSATWFGTINPGDTIFVSSRSAVSISWP